MGLVENLTFTKTAGVFIIILVLFSWGAQAIVGAVQSYKTGSVKPLLEATGGKVLSIDLRLKQDVVLLRDPSVIKFESSSPLLVNRVQYLIVDDIILNVAILFLAGLGLFKFMIWLSGDRQWDVLTQVLVLLLVIASFCVAEVVYSYYASDGVVIYPLEGVLGEGGVLFYAYDVINNPDAMISTVQDGMGFSAEKSLNDTTLNNVAR